MSADLRSLAQHAQPMLSTQAVQMMQAKDDHRFNVNVCLSILNSETLRAEAAEGGARGTGAHNLRLDAQKLLKAVVKSVVPEEADEQKPQSSS